MLAYRFRAVDGLELSAQLADVARNNFARLRETCAAIFTDAATSFARYGDYNFYSLYNPFPAIVMKPVLAALASQDRRDGERIIIYNNPTCHAKVAAGWTLMRKYPDQWGNGIHVYSNRPGQSRLAGASVGDAVAA
jgi:hypothetical protein